MKEQHCLNRRILDAGFEMRTSFQLEKLSDWFEEWINNQGGNYCNRSAVLELLQLLTPCWKFDAHQAFAHVTLEAVGNCSEQTQHLTAISTFLRKSLVRSKNLLGLSLTWPNCLGEFNNAETNLKTKIHQVLYPTIRGFLSGDCSYKDGLFAYELRLNKTGAWH